MAIKKSRLGRGLDGMISAGVSESVKKTTKKNISQEDLLPEGFLEINIKDVVPNPYQPRREMDPEKVKELAESIQAEGLLQPIVVRKNKGKYELIAGERRWRASTSLGKKKIIARIIKANEAASAVLSLVENLQRENLNAIEESLGYSSLMRDFDLTQEIVAERVGKSRSSVANALRLLQLEGEIQAYLSQGLLSVGHAKVLLGLEEGEQRILLTRRIIEEQLSVRATERLVNSMKKADPVDKAKIEKKALNEALQAVELKLGNHFNTSVALKHNSKKGKIVIDYFGNEDLERILDKLGI